jgi:hypothetical protein
MREETGVISDCERDRVVLRNGGVRRLGIVYSLDYGRLMGVPNCSQDAELIIPPDLRNNPRRPLNADAGGSHLR